MSRAKAILRDALCFGTVLTSADPLREPIMPMPAAIKLQPGTNSYRLLLLFMAALSSVQIHAASVMTTNGRLQGKILNQNADAVTVETDSGSTQVIKKLDILIIYDDAGNALWQNPDIVASDTAGGATPAATDTPLAKVYSVEVHGGMGLSSPSSIFSSFYASSGPDYHYEFAGEAAGLWHFTDNDSLVLGAGFAQRNFTAAGINLNGQRGSATWSMQFVDTRIGYRLQGNLGFAELGFLYAIPLRNVPVQHQSGAGTTSINATGITQQSYGAIYLSAGFNWRLNDRMALLTFARMDQGLGSVVRGEVATQVDFAGKAESTATLALVPWSVGVYLGASYRL